MKIFIAVLGEYSKVIGWLGATSKRFLKEREHCWISWRGCFKELGNFKSFNFGNCNVGIKSNIEGFCSPIAERVGWKTCWTNLCKQCKLPSDSIVEFFTVLCGVSAEEIVCETNVCLNSHFCVTLFMWDWKYGGFVNNFCVNLWLYAFVKFYAFDKLTLLQCICVLDYMSYYALLCVNLFCVILLCVKAIEGR